ncbi:TniQ family protein [Krasilnikovia cinnamomea]|uniref:TniQ family protein n=1 Tax=Krasilnikovia cinnamomea TaxID=349313 RepID=UPI00102AB558|nr:TniQ family protein [Krasilnikovia cinnamomea]
MAAEPTTRRRTCAECPTRLSPTARWNAKYCTEACRARAWRRTQRRLQAAAEGPRRPQRCPVCGQDIFTSDLVRTDTVYCSTRCRTRAWRARISGTGPAIIPDLRSLPSRPRPIDHETLTSYLQRLAAANHLAPATLVHHLHGRWAPTASVNVERLAAAVEMPERFLRYALPELRNAYEHAVMNKAGRNVDLIQTNIRPACRLCMAARGILQRVHRWTAPEHNVCLRHGLWIGTPQHDLEDVHQPEISLEPEIAAAQKRHLNLHRRYRRPAVTSAYTEASAVCALWATRNAYPDRRTRRAQQLNRDTTGGVNRAVAAAAIYPDVVALTSLLASSHWRALAGQPASLALFCAEVSRRIGHHYEPGGSQEPMARWIREQQQLPISPHAVEW